MMAARGNTYLLRCLAMLGEQGNGLHGQALYLRAIRQAVMRQHCTCRALTRTGSRNGWEALSQVCLHTFSGGFVLVFVCPRPDKVVPCC